MIAAHSRRAVIVIPAYEPTAKLVEVVEEVRGDGRLLIVVDDGSSAECGAVFSKVSALRNVMVLTHAVKLGKGQALKTAFNHVLLHAPADAVGVVTADADGQHLPADIRRVAGRLEQAGTPTLILGSRAFQGTVPLRSRIGNVLTRRIFTLLIGRALTDTQTGLRGIPRSFLGELMQLEAGRYEFELEMLIRATRRMPIEELTIETVYGSFAKSHFNPLRDSLRIYFVFLRFISLSIITAGIDYATFAIVFSARRNILLSIIIARAIAGTFNFIANRNIVFRSRGPLISEALKFATLVITLMSISCSLVTAMVGCLGFGVYTSKLVAEGALFAVRSTCRTSWCSIADAEPPKKANWLSARHRREYRRLDHHDRILVDGRGTGAARGHAHDCGAGRAAKRQSRQRLRQQQLGVAGRLDGDNHQTVARDSTRFFRRRSLSSQSFEMSCR
ncbi:MAG: bifunctional glycosyltransferase family 2/GtrA family protein [Cyanobacteria bacterium]|nr:bifunctional glycosyltransferase family 2/GtrA family protein [Cyanobacteriota bacterium]